MLKHSIITVLLVFSFSSDALEHAFSEFIRIHQPQLSQAESCDDDVFRVCSKALRNKGNAPYILHHDNKTDVVVVLFHGLSDSPYYFTAVAKHLHGLGFNVIVPLLPGHGLKDAHEIMQDSDLSDIWRAHVNDVMAMAPAFAERVYIGGFSTGAALATEYTLSHPNEISGLLLFSAALALSENAESLSRIWGIQLLARLMDGDYQTDGPNPYKYPAVSNSAAMELMEVITAIRDAKEANAPLSLPIFTAHSEVDVTTPLQGVEQLLAYNRGTNTAFFINASHDVCHGDIMLTTQMVDAMNIDKTTLELTDPCSVPMANPVFERLANLLDTYFASVISQ